MATAPSSGHPFVEPNLPPPYAQKRKATTDQADAYKKPRGSNQFAETNSHDDWFGNAGSRSNTGQSSADSSLFCSVSMYSINRLTKSSTKFP